MRFRNATVLAVLVCAALSAPAAHAISVKAGKWKLSFNGNVNAHYIYSQCEKHPNVVVGGLACVANSASSSVSNGLLPAALTVSGSTLQDGYHIGFTFGLYPGISTNDGGSPNLQVGSGNFGHTALGTAGLDVRQAFLTVGNKRFGTIMAGRNIGLFASDAILNDMTLLGVGAGNGNYAAPANTSLGSIGLGYIYTDWLAQIDYTTPTVHGANVTVGIFDPLNTLGQVPANHSTPGFQAKVTYTLGNLYLSASGLYQRQAIACSDPSLNATACVIGANNLHYSSAAFDIGGKYTAGPFQIMSWYYRGTGVGTTGLFVNSNDSLGHPRGSEGFIAQLTYTYGKTKYGINYGQSKLDPTALDLANGTLVEMNDKWTAGIYHHLTHNLLVVGEFSRLQSTNDMGQKNASWNINAGLFLSF
jgi:predicted porin